MEHPGLPPFAFVQALIFIWLLIERVITYYRKGRKIAFWSVIAILVILVAISFLSKEASAVVIVYTLVLVSPVWSFILALTHSTRWKKILFSLVCFPLAAISILVTGGAIYFMIFGKG